MIVERNSGKERRIILLRDEKSDFNRRNKQTSKEFLPIELRRKSNNNPRPTIMRLAMQKIIFVQKTESLGVTTNKRKAAV